MNDFNLSQFDDDFTNTTAPEKGAFPVIPDGKYQVRVEALDLKKSKQGNAYIAFELQILSGEFAGKKLFKNSVITAGSMPYLKQDLQTLGWTGKLSELEDPSKRRVLLDVTLQVTVKSKGQDEQGRPNVNVYLDRQITVDASVAAASAEKSPF